MKPISRYVPRTLENEIQTALCMSVDGKWYTCSNAVDLGKAMADAR